VHHVGHSPRIIKFFVWNSFTCSVIESGFLLGSTLILLKLLSPCDFCVVLCSHASLVLQWVSTQLRRRRIIHHERRFEPWILRHSNDSGYAESDVCRHGNAFLALKLIVIYFQLAMSLTLWTCRCWNGVRLSNYGPLSLCIASTTFLNTCSITLSSWMWVCLKRWLIHFKGTLRLGMSGDADEAPSFF